MYNLSEKELHLIHEGLLGLLRVFRDVCEKENIWYSLAFGTVLGAVRHKGFIPWDTDADVYIKLPDVHKFREAFKKHHPDGVLINDRESNPKNTKSHDIIYFEKKTSFSDLHLDIYPLVGAPDDPKEQRKFWKKCQILDKIFRSKYVNVADCIPKNKPIVTVVKFLDRLIPDSIIKANIDKREKQNDFESSNYWFSLVGAYGPVDKHVFDTRELMKFENDEFYVPGNWDLYLKTCYGNYMTPRKY